MRDLRDNITPKASLYHAPGLRDTIALEPLFAVCQIYVTIFPLKRHCTVCQVYLRKLPQNVCLTWARFPWQYFSWNVPVPCARLSWHNCPKTSECHTPDFCDNIPSKTSLHRVPGLPFTIALKHLFAVCQVFLTIFPLTRSFLVCEVSMTQLP